MKQKLALLLLALCFVLVISGCGGKSLPQNSNGDEPNQPSKSTGKVDQQQSTTNLKTISDFFEAWDELFSSTETAINSYDDPFFGLELLVPSTELSIGIQYEILNLENENGSFKGKLPLSGFPAFIEKDGAKLTFGYEYVREEDGWAPSMKAGDVLVENGSCDLAKEVYRTETVTKRDDKMVDHTYMEFKRIKGGAMLCLRIYGSSKNAATDEERMANTCTFIKAGKGSLNFVLAEAQIGPAFEELSIINKSDLTKEAAIEMLEAAGYVIETTGSVIEGVLLIDP